jgi:hypothetical protein
MWHIRNHVSEELDVSHGRVEWSYVWTRLRGIILQNSTEVVKTKQTSRPLDLSSACNFDSSVPNVDADI